MYVSVIVLLSREDAVDLITQQLATLAGPGYTAEAIILVDNNRINRLNLQKAVEAIGFRNVTIGSTGLRPPSGFSINQRRRRIANLRNDSKALVGGSNFVFSFEDDTVLPHDPITKLQRTYAAHEGRVGLVSGIQVARWGREYVGAWRVDNLDDPDEYVTPAYQPGGVSQTDAAGMYCYLTPTALYKSVTYRAADPLGPDVDYGLQLRRKGYVNLLDWGVPCGHQTDEGVLWPGPETETYAKRFRDGHWRDDFLAKKE